MVFIYSYHLLWLPVFFIYSVVQCDTILDKVSTKYPTRVNDNHKYPYDFTANTTWKVSYAELRGTPNTNVNDILSTTFDKDDNVIQDQLNTHAKNDKSSTTTHADVTKDNSTSANKSTIFASLLSSILSSCTLTLITEFGDRTFILAATYALTSTKMTVFTATSSALILQTVFSTLAGQLLHYIPMKNGSKGGIFSLPLDDYGAAILLFAFGCIHLKAAYSDTTDHVPSKSTKKNNSVKVLKGNSRELSLIERNGLSPFSYKEPENMLNQETSESLTTVPYTALLDRDFQFDDIEAKYPVSNSSTDFSTNTGGVLPSTKLEESFLKPEDTEAYDSENTMKKLTFAYIFWVIFFAELGDKSMISTIALSTAQNPYGVFLGCSVSHIILTALAATLGGMLKGLISEKTINYIGGALFMVFALMTTMEGLSIQGIRMWRNVSDKISTYFLATLYLFRSHGKHSQSYL